MILGAAAAAVGISYLFHDEHQKRSTVTIASTLVDPVGVVKKSFYAYKIKQERMLVLQLPRKSTFKIETRPLKRETSLIFFWFLPLKTRSHRVKTQDARIQNKFQRYERFPVRMTVGVQNETSTFDRSPTVLSNENSFATDSLTPIGILKRKDRGDNTEENRSNSNDQHSMEIDDGRILYRGERFLGERWTRIDQRKHSIDDLYRLLTRKTRRLMKENRIETIEDLIEFYLIDGEENFCQQLTEIFDVHRTVVDEIRRIFHRWISVVERPLSSSF